MHAVVGEIEQNESSSRGYLLPVIVGGLLLVFFAAPWSIEHKAHAALHGLCAQTPSHTFLMGDRPLPFDARMTGIYGGFIATALYLVGRGRHRAALLPTLPVMGVLALLVGLMAVDGFNSLFLDLGRPHPYQPHNGLRLVTGVGTGISLAIILCYLCAVTLWRRPDTNRRVAGWRDLALLVPVQAPFLLSVAVGPGVLWFPTMLLLLLAAVTAVSTLALVTIVLLRRLDFTFDRFGDVQPVAATAVLTAVAVMATLSGGRFLLERLLGLPPLT